MDAISSTTMRGVPVIAPQAVALRAPVPVPTPAPAPAPRPPEAPQLDATVLVGVAATAGVAALTGAGLLLAHARAGTRGTVIGMVDGVELLSNPRIPADKVGVTWGVPTTGTLFGPTGRASIEDIDQGRLGDCWYLGTLGAIAHRWPDRIQQLVRESGDHVVVSLPGRTVAVTRELPLNAAGSPAFAGSDASDPVLWPAYVEKAQAALARNGYASLVSGFAKDAFRQLLGARPAHAFTRGTILDDVQHHDAVRDPVVLSTVAPRRGDAATRARLDQLGLLPGHQYIQTAVDGDGPDARVTLFNPWGRQHPPAPIAGADLEGVIDGLDSPGETIRYAAGAW